MYVLLCGECNHNIDHWYIMDKVQFGAKTFALKPRNFDGHAQHNLLLSRRKALLLKIQMLLFNNSMVWYSGFP